VKPICETVKLHIRFANLVFQKLPYILVVGAKEKADGTVSVRARGGKDLGVMKIEDFIKLLQEDVRLRRQVEAAN